VRRAFAFALLSAVMLAFVVARLDVRTAITDFLPEDVAAGRLALARELAQGAQARVAILTLSAPEASKHRTAARTLAERMRGAGAFAWVRAQMSEADQRAAFQLLHAARFALLDVPDAAGPVSDAWIKERVEDLYRTLRSPAGMMVRPWAASDPLGAMAPILTRLERLRGDLTVEEGQLVTKDGRASILFAATRAQGLDASAQRKVVDFVEAQRRELAQHGVSLRWTSVGRFVVHGEDSAKADIARISLWSSIAIFLLYGWVFRSVREPILGFLPIAFGCLAACAACQLVFGFVHAIALAFGSSIIGVGIDYPTHFFVHRRATSADTSSEQVMRELWPALLLGAITTALGIGTLAAGGLTGLAQMAVFGGVGIVASLFATRWILPPFTPVPRVLLFQTSSRWLARPLTGLAKHRSLSIAALVLVLAASTSSLSSLEFADGLASLRTAAPELDRETAAVHALLGNTANGRVLVSQGADDSQALQNLEALARELQAQQKAGSLASFRSAAFILRAEGSQRAALAKLRADPTLPARLEQSLAARGFVTSAFEPIATLLANATTLPREQVMASSLASMLEPLRVALPSGVAYLTTVSGTTNGALEAIALKVPGTTFIDQATVFDEAYARLRARVTSLVALGVGMVLLALWLRYRSLRLCLLAVLPACVGGVLAVASLHALGMPIHLLHVVGLVLVLSMGEDYGIYMIEARGSLDLSLTTLHSIGLAVLTTVLSFGLLALSDSPALSAIGWTVSLGLSFALLVTPLVIVLARREAS
jgi:predicted exporter